MNAEKNSYVHLILGILFIAAGLVTIIGLMVFASPCPDLLPAGIPRRCYSVGLMQRGVAAVIIAIGVFAVLFRKSAERIKGLNITAFLLGILLVLSATVLTATCNLRAHELLRGETPSLENMFTHTFEDIGNIYIAWTNFTCNTGSFVPFVTAMGVVIAVIAGAYALFADKAALHVKPSPKSMGLVFIGLGAFALVGLRTFATPCTALAGTNLLPMLMRCADVAAHMYGISVISIVSGLLIVLFGHSKDFQKGLNAALGLLGVLAFVLPLITETCGNPAMPCNTTPFNPFMQVVGALMVIASVANAVLLSRKGEDEVFI